MYYVLDNTYDAFCCPTHEAHTHIENKEPPTMYEVVSSLTQVCSTRNDVTAYFQTYVSFVVAETFCPCFIRRSGNILPLAKFSCSVS